MIVSPEYKALELKHQALVLRMAQQDMIVKKKDDQINLLSSQITPLKNFVQDLKVVVENLQAQNELLIKTLEQKEKQLDKLSMIEHQYDQLKKLLYAKSSEKSGIVINPAQLLLGMNVDIVEACNINDAQKVSAYTKYKPTNENHPGRNAIPRHIHREYVDMHPDGLPEGTEKFDVIETEQLEYDPARIFATVYRRHKYKLVKPDGTTEIFIAPLPAEKDKCLAAPSLKAHVTIDKYLYHMPLFRQSQELAQLGMLISENTMGGWVSNTAHSVTAIYECLRKDVVHSASKYLMADETSITVLDKEKLKGKKCPILVICGRTATRLTSSYFLSIKKAVVTNMQDLCLKILKAHCILTAIMFTNIMVREKM